MHAGRLAVEQLYGYMVRNHKRWGLLSTVDGWCFAYREDGARFFMTRMYGQGTAEGYHSPGNGFTLMMALYFFTARVETEPNLIETTGGHPGVIWLPPASADTAQAAPYASIIQQNNQPQYILPAPVPNYYNQYQQRPQPISLLFEPWEKANHLGHKSWIARTLPEKSKVVLKTWDAWRVDTTDRDNEENIYLRLEPLQGKYVAKLLASTNIDFLDVLIIEYLDVIPSPGFFFVDIS